MTNLNILLIEDDLVIATDLKADLEDAGHQVIGIARNATEAMKLIKANPPDIAVVDITLGHIEDGGIQLVSELLNHHWMPIIYLTAHSDAVMVDKAFATSPAAYMLKPFRVTELLVQIKLAYENFKKNESGNVNRPFTLGENFYFPNKTGHDRVNTNDILFMKAQGHCTDLYLNGEKKPRMIGTNLGHLADYFTTSNFLRLSKSLFINLDHLVQIERTCIYLGQERFQVDISEANRKELMKKLKVIRTK
ncbi:hypothetical protein GCM10028806_27130 [Spirosoma terrae]|uniref:Response regulator transcription factor n=1 Tax=Spirosoma terrae TaxID=1968276 RepID=A0A6L9L9Y7_9BACT|nr:response regulator transcription factor [Spirosoma terrae]NDU97326.1 response regulator transcription factor [Spirosoma terrae]